MSKGAVFVDVAQSASVSEKKFEMGELSAWKRFNKVLLCCIEIWEALRKIDALSISR